MFFKALKFFFFLLGAFILFSQPRAALAVEVAPRITDREIVERLTTLETKLEAVQKSIDKRFDDINSRFDDLRSEMNSRFDAMNKRFDTLQWMFGLFITVALAIFAAIGKVLWDLNRARASMEKSLETQKDELAFLKSLIEKLLPPRGVL